ncbi:B12-binding domain-containing radical SAM protein [Sulfurimonas sp.]|uniref:B12-binding domain-containing radical SAM protein n=1 Tax=Sulfurimonas sp. TaxID=2022749 RepID=UPI0025E64943|nr:B12-binding domain-containing radical SAM protein [Sulfurimonas sp.]
MERLGGLRTSACNKKVSPDAKVILGGPEVSHKPFRVNFDNADYIIQGEGDLAFYELCKKIIAGNAPVENIIKMSMPSLKNVALPYRYYTDDDIKNRYIYVEASRGCPFACEFCLSSMDEKVRSFDLDTLLEEFELLWQRGARNFKFIDRTFNLNIKTANLLLDFFLKKPPPYFAHFEVVPDHFPDSLKSKIALFSEGALQLEIGIQTLNEQIANNISRPLKLDKIKENIKFLEHETKTHMHLDLIVGLPGESLESFGANLDELVRLSSCEIQIGILKKLSGTYINRHDIEHGMIYSDIPPYDVLQTSKLSFHEIGVMKRFSRFWDLTYNSGNFKESVKLIWQDGSVFENFYKFSLWIYTQTDSTWQISLQRLGELLFRYLCEVKNLTPELVAERMLSDMMKLKGRAIPEYLKEYAIGISTRNKEGTSGFNKRQH